MKHDRLLSLRIRHAYHDGEQCADLIVEPALETRRWLQAHRCLLRVFPDGVAVSVAMDGGKPFLPWSSGTRLTFHLRLANPEFPLFTDLEAFAVQSAPLFVQDGNPTSGPVILALKSRTATRTESLRFPPDAATADFALGGRPLAGAPAGAFLLRGLADDAAVVLGPTDRQVRISATPNRLARAFTLTYPCLAKLPAGVFADAELAVPDVPPTTGVGVDYEIRFRPRTAPWRYYVVTSAAGPTAPFAVEAGQTISFQRTDPDPADRVTQALKAQYGALRDLRVDCYTSTSPLPCRPVAPSGLRLKAQGQTDEGEPLPPPPLTNLCEIAGAPAFFQVIRKLKNP